MIHADLNVFEHTDISALNKHNGFNSNKGRANLFSRPQDKGTVETLLKD